jgi:hypothetical protein
MPQAGQVVETGQGPMRVNTRTGEAAPIMAGGQPLPPKLSTEQSKDITAINQQRAVVDSALKLVQTTPTAFSFGRGVAGAIPLGETIAGRTEKPAETEARAAVFNIVSKVINERAGAAQSNQEIKRLNAFLPSEVACTLYPSNSKLSLMVSAKLNSSSANKTRIVDINLFWMGRS